MKIFTLILLCTVLNAADSTSTAFKWVVAGQAADLVTTEIILANGGMEANPLMTDRAVRIIAKTSLLLAAHIYAKRYPKDRWSMIIFAVISWIPVGNNLANLTRE